MKTGDVVIHKMTRKEMMVLKTEVYNPNFPFDQMVCCRYQLPHGIFAVDNFLKEELIYEEIITPGSQLSPITAEDLRKKPGDDVQGTAHT